MVVSCFIMSKNSLIKGVLMPRTKAQYAQLRQATKEKIQSAAMEVFVRKGFGAANVQEIADTAGISIGLLYRHYRSKEDLFQELTAYAEAGIDELVELFSSDESPKRLIRQFAQTVYDDMTTGSTLAYLMVVMSHSSFAQIDSAAAASPADNSHASSRLLEAMSRLIQRGQRLGECAAGDADQMANLFLAALQGLAEMKVLLKTGFTMPSPTLLTSFLFPSAPMANEPNRHPSEKR